MGRSRCQDVDFRSWRRNGLSGETQCDLGPARGAIASPLTMDRVRQLPVASERVTTDSFSRWPGKRSHMARPWAQAVLLPNQTEARGADRLASRRYSGANFRRCGVFFWANQCEELTAGSARGGGLEF